MATIQEILSSAALIENATSRNIDDFSATRTIKNLVGNQEFSQGFNEFDCGVNTPNTGVWQSLSAIADDLGETIYSNVLHYIDNVSNVDVCKVRALRSMLSMVGTSYKVIDKIRFYPIEIQSIIDILSINKKYLLNNQFMKQCFVNALSSANVISIDQNFANISQDSTQLSSQLCHYVVLGNSQAFTTCLVNIISAFLYDMLSMPIAKEDQLSVLSARIGANANPADFISAAYAYNQIDPDQDGYGPSQNLHYDKYIQAKKSLNIKNNFDVKAEVDKVVIGQASMYDYTFDEQVLMYSEIEYRRKMPLSLSASIVVDNMVRSAYYKKMKVVEYANFIDNMANLAQISNYQTYDYDTDFFVETTNPNREYVLTKTNDPIYKYTINTNIIESAAKNIVAIIEYIAKIREIVRFQVRKVYMKGTNILLRYCINEFLIDYATQLKNTFQYSTEYNDVLSIISKLSSHDWLDVEVQEYWDKTEYMNLSTSTSLYAYGNKQVNPRYFDEVFSVEGNPNGDWHLQPKDGTGVFDLSDINEFYLSSLGLKNTLLPAVSSHSSANELSSRFYDFLSVIFDIAANKSYYDDEYGVFGTKLQNKIITHNIHNDLSLLLSVDSDIMDVADEIAYSFSGLSTIQQQIDGLFTTWQPVLEDKYLSQVSVVYETYFPQATQICIDFQNVKDNLSSLLNQKYASYFCQSTNSYSYDEYGQYMFPYFVGNSNYSPNDYFTVYLNNASDWIDENCHTYALSSAVSRLSAEYDDIHDHIYADIVDYIVLSGFNDVNLADLSEEMDTIKSFLNGKITSRTDYLRQALQNFRDQANQLKSAYDSYVVSFQSVLASMPDTTQGWYIKWVGKGNGSLKALKKETVKDDDNKIIYDQYSQKLYEPVDGNGTFLSVNFKDSNDIKESQTLIQNINCALGRLEECSNIYYGISMTANSAGLYTAASAGVSRSFGTQKQALQALIANVVKLGTQVDSILDQVKDMYQIDSGANSFTSMYVKGSTSTNIDYNAKIIALISYLGTEITDAEFNNDVVLSAYNSYVKTLTDISSTFIPVRNEYEVLWSKFSTFLQGLEKTSDYKSFTPLNLDRIETYRINKDKTALIDIQNDFDVLRDDYKDLVSRFIAICAEKIELYKSPTLMFVYQYTGDVLEECLADFVACLVADVNAKVIIGNESIDNDIMHIKDCIAVIANGDIPFIHSEGLYYKYFSKKFEPYESNDKYNEYEQKFNAQLVPFTDIIDELKNLLEYNKYEYFQQQKIMFQNYTGIVLSAVLDGTELSNGIISKDPYYNYKNQTHPSFQIHPFLWYFEAVIRVKYAIDTIASSIVNINYEDLEAANIAWHLDKYLGSFGNLIDVWKNNIRDFTSYTTRYEQSNHVCKYTGKTSEVVDYDGAFYPPALNDYLNKWKTALSNDFLSSWYGHLDIDDDQSMKDVVISGLASFNDISVLTQDRNELKDVYDIYSYQVDQYGNAYTLYKKYSSLNPSEEEKLSTCGQLWVRFADSPMSFKWNDAVDVDKDVNGLTDNSQAHEWLDNLVDFQIASSGNKGFAIYAKEMDFPQGLSKCTTVNAVHIQPFNIEYKAKETTSCGIAKIDLRTRQQDGVLAGDYYGSYDIIPYDIDLSRIGQDASGTEGKYKKYVGTFSLDGSIVAAFIECIIYPYSKIPDNPRVWLYTVYTDDSRFQCSSIEKTLNVYGIKNTFVPMSFYIDSTTNVIVDFAFITNYQENGKLDVKRWPDGNIAGQNSQLSLDMLSAADGTTIDDPRPLQMNSLDVFSDSLDIASIVLGNSNGMNNSNTGSMMSFQTNADIGYNPSYAGLSVCGPLDVKGDFKNLSYSSIELLGKEKDLDWLASHVNISADPYISKEDIYEKYIFGRAWEDGSGNDITSFNYSLDQSLAIYGNYPFYVGMPELSNGNGSTFSYNKNEEERIDEFVWKICLSSYQPIDLSCLKVYLYSTTSAGKNPYIAKELSSIIRMRGKDISADYDQTNEYIYNDFSIDINKIYGVHAIGTQNGVNEVDISYSNKLDNIANVVYQFDYVDGIVPWLTIKFVRQDNRLSYIAKDCVKLVLANVFDMRFYEKLHILDTGTTYDEAMVELNKVSQLRQLSKEDLEQLPLSTYNALSDVIFDNNRIFDGYRKLSFKTDEDAVFNVSDINYYIPSLNTKYPLTFGQAYTVNHELGTAVADDIVKIFNMDEVYVIDVQDAAALDQLSSKIVEFVTEWSNELDMARVYEDYLAYDTEQSCSNSQKYPYESPHFFEYVHFYGTRISPGNGIFVKDSTISSDLVDMDEGSTDEFSQWTSSSRLSCSSIEHSSQYEHSYVNFNYQTMTSDEKTRFKKYAEKFLQIYMGYKKTPSGIVIYANYQNFINTPFLKIKDGKLYADVISQTYARIDPGKSAQLDIVVQLRLEEYGKTVAIKNIIAASYIVYNISDDKPKFIVRKMTDAISFADGEYGQVDAIVRANDVIVTEHVTMGEGEDYISAVSPITLDSKYQLDSPISCTIAYPPYLAYVLDALQPIGVSKVAGIDGQAVVEFTNGRKSVDVGIGMKKDDLLKYNMTKHQIAVIDVENNNPFSISTYNGKLAISCDITEQPVMTLRFDPNGGRGSIQPIVGISGDIKQIPTEIRFSRPGYELSSSNCLNKKRDGSGTPSYSPGDNITLSTSSDIRVIWLYAQWLVKNTTLSFNSGASGASGSMQPITQQATMPITLPQNTFTYTGHTFSHWKSTQGGSIVTYTDQQTIIMPEEDCELTAQWNKNTYTVRFIDWDNSVLKQMQVDYGNKATPPPNPTRGNYYDFSGWNPDPDSIITANTDFYAQYTFNDPSIIIEFKSDDPKLNGWSGGIGLDDRKFKPGTYNVVAIGSGGSGHMIPKAVLYGNWYIGWVAGGGSGAFLSGQIEIKQQSDTEPFGILTIQVQGRTIEGKPAIIGTSIAGKGTNNNINILVGRGGDGDGYIAKDGPWKTAYVRPGGGGKVKTQAGVTGTIKTENGKSGQGIAGGPEADRPCSGGSYAVSSYKYGGGSGANGGKTYDKGYGFVHIWPVTS